MFDKVISTIIAHKAGIMLGAAAAGVVATAIVAVKDSKKHEDALNRKECELLEAMSDEEYTEYSEDETIEQWDIIEKKDKAIIFAKSYWRTGLCMAVTFGLMILSHRTMVKELAATAAALGVMSTKYKELAATLKEKYPDTYEKVTKIIDQKNARKAISEKPFIKEETYDGRIRYFEPWSAQVFYATQKEELEAEKLVNEKIFNEGEASLHNFLASFPKHCKVKLEPWMKHIGWYEGDTLYSYNSAYFGPYLNPKIVETTIVYKGEVMKVHKIEWNIDMDLDPTEGETTAKMIEDVLSKKYDDFEEVGTINKEVV